MLGVAMYTTIKTLKELGRNKSEIARTTGHDWKTVNKVIKDLERGKELPVMKDRDSIIDPYKEKVLELLGQDVSAVRIHEELQRIGCGASYSGVKSMYEG